MGAGLLIRSTRADANDRIRMGVVGLRSRGRDHVRGFARIDGVEIAALCDADENMLNQRAQELSDSVISDVKKYVDYRDMLADDSIDAVAIATPNHWHAIQGIWACQAGKDAYVEKPCSHNIREGRLLVEAARKYDRIVAHGTQGRSVGAFREAMDLLHSGYIGEVYYAKGICYKWRDTIHRSPVEPVPPNVDYDLWTGPAPKQPFTRNRFHYNWHWIWDTGNGDIGNQGVHEMDIARWGLGVGLPKVAQAMGGHFMFDDDQTTPNTMIATYKYPDENKMLVFEVRHWITNDEFDIGRPGNMVGDLFLGSEGYMITSHYGSYKTFFGQNREPGKEGSSGENHFENYIQALRSRNRDELNAEIEEGHLSSALCHLGNAAYRVERTIRFDPQTERALDDPEADAILQGKDRGYRAPYSAPDEV